MKQSLSNGVTRRGFLAGGVVAAVGVGLPRWVWAQEEVPAVLKQYREMGATARIETVALRGNVSVLMGSGGNIAVLAGKDGKVLVDSGMSTSQPQITAALAGISAEPVKHLINSHWHFDHTDGNAWMHGAGAVILAQENAKKRLATPQEIAFMQARFPASPAAAIPTETFAEKKTLTWNGETIRLEHYAPAHTDGDIYVHFEKADVMHIADTWFNGFYPFIDGSSGGRIDGMIAAADRSLAVAGAKTIIIPGHGPVGDKAGLTAYRDMLVANRAAIGKLKTQGKSLEETIAAKPTAPFDAKWGGGFMAPAAFVTVVYQTL